MTAYKIINRISSVALAAASLLLAPALAGCSSEADPVPNPTPEPTPSEMATINLSVAAPFSPSTRAEDDKVDPSQPTGEERTVKNIWIYFYSVDKNNPEDVTKSTLSKAFEITSTSTQENTVFPTNGLLPNGNESNASTTSNYTPVINKFNIPSGDYRIYALANIGERGLTNISPADRPNENYLRNTATLPVISGGVYKLSSSAGVPMMADPMDHTSTNTVIYIDSPSSSTVSTDVDNKKNGIVTIGSGETQLYLTMTYMVAKVQLSVVFNNKEGGCSYPYYSMQVSSLTAKNMAGATHFGIKSENVINEKRDDGCAVQSLMKYQKLPLNWNSNSPTTIDDEITSEDDGYKNGTYMKPLVYQGTFYLPESRYVGDSKAYMELKAYMGSLGLSTTELRTYNIYMPDITNQVDDEHTLTRGHYYDVVANITPSGMEFNVKVRKWQNFKRDIFEF